MDKGPARRTVLICDDDSAYRDVEARLLADAGYQARVVGRGDLLGEVGGGALIVIGVGETEEIVELAHAIRENPASRGVSLLVTALRDLVDLRTVVSEGANRVLWKPFSSRSFMRQVEELANVPRRLAANVEVRIRRCHPDLGVPEGRVVNMSETGMLVYCPDPMEIGEVCRLDFVDLGGESGLKAEVMRQARERGPGHVAMRILHPRVEVRNVMDQLHLIPAAPTPPESGAVSDAPGLHASAEEIDEALDRAGIGFGLGDDAFDGRRYLRGLGELRLALQITNEACDHWVPLMMPPRLISLLDGTRTAQQIASESGMSPNELAGWLRRLIELRCLETPTVIQ